MASTSLSSWVLLLTLFAVHKHSYNTFVSAQLKATIIKSNALNRDEPRSSRILTADSYDGCLGSLFGLTMPGQGPGNFVIAACRCYYPADGENRPSGAKSCVESKKSVCEVETTGLTPQLVVNKDVYCQCITSRTAGYLDTRSSDPADKLNIFTAPECLQEARGAGVTEGLLTTTKSPPATTPAPHTNSPPSAPKSPSAAPAQSNTADPTAALENNKQSTRVSPTQDVEQEPSQPTTSNNKESSSNVTASDDEQGKSLQKSSSTTTAEENSNIASSAKESTRATPSGVDNSTIGSTEAAKSQPTGTSISMIAIGIVTGIAAIAIILYFVRAHRRDAHFQTKDAKPNTLEDSNWDEPGIGGVGLAAYDLGLTPQVAQSTSPINAGRNDYPTAPPSLLLEYGNISDDALHQEPPAHMSNASAARLEPVLAYTSTIYTTPDTNTDPLCSSNNYVAGTNQSMSTGTNASLIATAVMLEETSEGFITLPLLSQQNLQQQQHVINGHLGKQRKARKNERTNVIVSVPASNPNSAPTACKSGRTSAASPLSAEQGISMTRKEESSSDEDEDIKAFDENNIARSYEEAQANYNALREQAAHAQQTLQHLQEQRRRDKRKNCEPKILVKPPA